MHHLSPCSEEITYFYVCQGMSRLGKVLRVACIIRELEEKKAGIEGNLLHNQMDKIYYLDAAILSCKAMITYAHRYADKIGRAHV